MPYVLRQSRRTLFRFRYRVPSSVNPATPPRIDKIIAEGIAAANASCAIKRRSFEFFERLQYRKLISSPSSYYLAHAFERNAFAGIQLGCRPYRDAPKERPLPLCTSPALLVSATIQRAPIFLSPVSGDRYPGFRAAHSVKSQFAIRLQNHCDRFFQFSRASSSVAPCVFAPGSSSTNAA